MTCTSDVEQNGRNCNLKRIGSVKFMTCFNVTSSHFKRGVKEANKMSVNTAGRSADIEIRYL